MASEGGIAPVGDGSLIEEDERFYLEELQLASRNKSMPLEALHYDVTPTGMHYLLVHFDVPAVDPATWQLAIGGHVERPYSLTLEGLQRRPSTTLRVTLECAGNGRALLQPRPISQPWLTGGVGTAEWTGTTLAPILREAGLREGAKDVVFAGLDHGIEGGVELDYRRSLSVGEALHEDVLLAWAMNGRPLEPQHGYPLRLVVPGWYGMASVKWLRSIEVLDSPSDVYHNVSAYRYRQSRDEAGEPVTLIQVRSLMVPPGFPDFLTRTRIVHEGPIELQGRAWSGRARITRVEVSVDGGATWADAEVGGPVGPYAWQGWRYVWEAAPPGEYELCCRAHDNAGNTQPLEQLWTVSGVGNNAVQRLRVLVV